MPEQPNTALALAQALHRYAQIEDPIETFDAVCADWPHAVAVLVNDYLFSVIDELDHNAEIAVLERELARLRAGRDIYPTLKTRRRAQD